jgi:hypothetical protein
MFHAPAKLATVLLSQSRPNQCKAMTNNIRPGKTPPAEGERRALRNLSAQYRVAGKLVYDALIDGELEWVRLLDPEAGRLDDVQIAQSGRLDAYQIKWSDYRRQVTFNQLISETTVSSKCYPAPFKLLADGWQALQAAHPDRIVRAHYLAHDAASSNDGSKADGAGEPPHLQAFLRHAWPVRGAWFQDEQADIGSRWRLKIDAIAACTGLAHPDLARFLPRCELDLGFDIDEHTGRRNERRQQDIDALGEHLMRRAATSAGVWTISRVDLLRELGWTDRFELSFKHDFPVDERLYRPVDETVASIRQALTDHERGYIALVGPPGSGKSTTLTHTLRYSKGIRLVRYYAFVRDDPRPGRGEAEAFLHDLCLSLEPFAPGAKGQRPVGDDLASYRDQLGALLGRLSEEWQASGIKTVILVDGLDHIEREQNPERSLIHELPHPDAIPRGVLVVLGSQRVGLEVTANSLRPITAQLEEPSRFIEMARLSRASIRSIADAALTPGLLRGHGYDQIEQLSGGHPLALAYLIKRLSAADDAEAVDAVIASSVSFEGEIERDYRAYWDALRGEADVRDLLGLVARLRGAIDLTTIEALASSSVIERFVATAQHYFHHDTVSSWRFFHNSFRRFVLEKTAQNAFGRPDLDLAISFHKRLAQAAGQSAPQSPLAWERPYHLDQAGAVPDLLAIDHQPYFRAQFLSGRPQGNIEEDIYLCMNAAAAAGQIMTVLGLMLAEKEVGDRASVLEQINLATLALRVAPPDDQPSALIVASELLVPDNVALDWAVALMEAGQDALASRVFDMAEPLDLLSGVSSIDASGQDEDLDAWASAAWRFRPLDEIVEAIGHVRVDVSGVAPPYESEVAADLRARAHLVATLGVSLLDAGEAERLDALRGHVPDVAALDHRLDMERVRRAIAGAEDRDVGAAALDRIIAQRQPNDQSPASAARLADLICGLNEGPERADPYLAAISAPLAVDSLMGFADDALETSRPLFRQARASAARGRPLDPLESVSTSSRDHERGWTFFQRAMIRLGTLWGEAVRGAKLPPSEVVRRLGPEIRFYRRDWNDTHAWTDWYRAQRAASGFFTLVLQTAHAHGFEAFRETLAAILADWKIRTPNLLGWTLEVRRSIALSAYRIDGDLDRTKTIFRDLDADIDITYDVHERVELWKASLDGWLEIGEREQASAARDAMIATSFALFEDRDSQIDDWTRWAARAMEQAGPAEREEIARLILGIVAILHKTRRGGGRDEAVRTIMAALARLEPAAALHSADWLMESGAAERSDILSGLVMGELTSFDPHIVADALTVASRLVLPFEIDTNADLAKRVASVARGDFASDPRVAIALEAYRLSVRTRIQHPAVYDDLLGTLTNDESNEKEKAKAPRLRCADGRTLSQRDLEKLAENPKALADALRGATNAGISWGKVFSAVPRPIDRGALEQIGQWLIDQDVGPAALLDLVRCSMEAEAQGLAERAKEAALARSHRAGWLRYYDGGSRLAAAECIALCDPAQGKLKALRLLVEDHIDRSLPIRDLIAELDNLLPIISDGIGPMDIWKVLSQHVLAIAEVTESNIKAPDFGDAPPLDLGELSARLLLTDLASSASAVAIEARKGLLARLESDDPGGFADRGLRQMLMGEVQLRTAALATIACLAISNPAATTTYLDAVRPMAWDPDSVVRRLAQEILVEAGDDIPDPPSRELPTIYRLQLPDAPMKSQNLRGGAILPGEPLPDTTDDIDLSRLFHDAFKIIEADTGHSFTTLARRHAQIMRSVSPPESWGADAERMLMKRLEQIGLKIAFRRPRSLVALQAFGQLVSELCDAGELAWPNGALDAWLLITDPYMDVRDPSPRPEWLLVPTGKDVGAYPVKDWLAGVQEAMPTLQQTPDGIIVLAELTSTTSLDGNHEEESRLSVISHARFKPARGMATLDGFRKDPNYIATDYPAVFGEDPPPSVVIAGGPWLCTSEFLALNPALGGHLGWTVSEVGLFRWVDSEGHMMAESLWWQEGNRLFNDRAGMDEASSAGWMVLASREGWRQMKPHLNDFKVHRRARRSAGERRDGTETVAIAGDDLPLPE